MNMRGIKYWAIAICILCAVTDLKAQNDNIPAARRHRESKVRIPRVDSFTIKDTTQLEYIINVNDTVEDNISTQKNVINIQEKENEIKEEAEFANNNDSLKNGVILLQKEDTVRIGMNNLQVADSIHFWMPDPKKALWMAIAIPGGGQIYNRKYWKLPIIYGGIMGCLYAMSWNNSMYQDYAQAYIDIMDDDPNTASYINFLPENYDVDANFDRLEALFKRKKNYYRRYRDLSIFIAIGVYALSVIDAYVDAELSSFDISRDLSMKLKPSIINDNATAYGIGKPSYGLKCSIAF